LLQACENLRIPARETPTAEVLHKEPALSPRITRAIHVPDGAIDPFRLIRSNVEDARQRGARVLPHLEVIAIKADGENIRGVRAKDPRTGEELQIDCRWIVNAAGVWAGRIASLAGASLEIIFSKGSLIVFNKRLVNTVINRCRPPCDGDIFVPHGPALILGTTSQTTGEIEDPSAEESEVDLLLSEGEQLLPGVHSTRAIRAYAGVRPLMGARESEGDSRTLSRDFLLVDHGETDGVKGFFSIVGGKLTTYRLMAERTVDSICRAAGATAPCTTAQMPLPFPENYSFRDLTARLRRIADSRYAPEKYQIYCECELISKEEISREIQEQTHPSLKEIQERTRAGMGPCQGGFCSARLIALLSEMGKVPSETSLPLLKRFLEERWKGTRPVLWGPQLREEQLIQALYAELYNLDHHEDREE
jgi:glycerol-3-phosphate dehydrogenase